MENLSNEELIGEFRAQAEICAGTIGSTSTKYLLELEAEIMSRFARYEQTLKEIAALADRMLEGK
jgi:hypothetical protein